jgi:hypothetical protein
VSRFGHILVALAYALSQAYVSGHHALERETESCCTPGPEPRLACGGDCDEPGHHHHRDHPRCATCAKSVVTAHTIALPAIVVVPTVASLAPSAPAPAPAAEPSSHAPRAPPAAL